MSKPPIAPEKTVAGIAVDPQTLDRVIPESRRPDGSVRKQIRIRPGFTPQEDVRRFRSTRQADADARALPPGHIIGWAPPPAPAPAPTKGLSKSAKKNAKRREKRRDGTDPEPVRDNWDDDDGASATPPKADATPDAAPATPDAAPATPADGLATALDNLHVTP